MLPVGGPSVAMKGAAERRHAVGAAHAPARPRLLHPPADHLLARPLHQPAADRLPRLQPPRVAQWLLCPSEILRDLAQPRPLRRRVCRRSRRLDVPLDRLAPLAQQRLLRLLLPALGSLAVFPEGRPGTSADVLQRVVDVQHPARPRQEHLDPPPDPLRPVGQDGQSRRVADAQPGRPGAPARPEALGRLDRAEQDAGVRLGQVTAVPVVKAGGVAALALGEGAQPHLAPALPGVDHRAVGVELDVTAGLAELLARRRALVQPIGEQPGLLEADLAYGLIAGAQAAELGEVLGRQGERPAGAGEAEQLAASGGDEALDAEALVQGVAARAAARADEVEPVQADVAGDGQEVARGLPFMPHALSARAGALRSPFFSTAWAWACKVASTAWRASSRAAGTARASTLERTWPSGAASAVCSSCWASRRACSRRSACSGVWASNVRLFMGFSLVRPPTIPAQLQNYQKLFTHPSLRAYDMVCEASRRFVKRTEGNRIPRGGQPRRGCEVGKELPGVALPAQPRPVTAAAANT